jgi:hypothetical protein
MKNVILKICSIPRDFYTHTDKSIVQLLEESGFIKYKDLISKSEIINQLKEHPSFIDDWSNYSGDKRTSKGWYLLNNDDGTWIVGYYDSNNHLNNRRKQEKIIDSDYEACAEFVLAEVEDLEKFISHK